LLLALSACSGNKTHKVPSSLSISPSSLDFHVVAIGHSAQQTLTLSSVTPAPVNISSYSIADDVAGSASAFSLSSKPTGVDAEGSTTVTVTFTPTTVQNYSAHLIIVSDDADHPQQTVALSGHGINEEVEVSLEAPTNCTAQINIDGGLSIDFGLVPADTSQVIWPNVLLENAGAAPAQLTGFHFDSDGGFYFPEPPTLPQTIGPSQTRSLPIAFQPPTSAGPTQFSGSVTFDFDDPATPHATIQLAAEVHTNLPPVVCAGIQSAEELDGTTNVATALGAAVPVEPGALVQLTAFADDVADAGSPACTFDPEDGRTNLVYAWSIPEAPAGSQATIAMPASGRTTFIPDQPGHYRIHLDVNDAQGAVGQPITPGAADVIFDAAPLADLTVRASWTNFPHVDLDLHFVKPGGTLFDPASDLFSLDSDGGHDWGTLGDPTDDPHFSGDDQGNGLLDESTRMNRPQDGCLPDGGCNYGVWVHYYQDHRDLSSASSCGGASCHEGDTCGCASGMSCEPNPGTTGACASWVSPRVDIYFKGQITPALSVPLPADTNPAELFSPCFTWHAANVYWPTADGGMALSVSNTDGGPDVEYWGAQTDATRQCTPGPGGWSETSPPLLSP
jgi:hypothetical protein